MNATYIVIFLGLVVVALAPWLITRVYDRSGDRQLKIAPELADVAPEERGRAWLGAVTETLLQWQIMLGFVVVLGLTGVLIVVMDGWIAERWNRVFLFLVLLITFFSTRRYIIRRARLVLVSKIDRSNDAEQP